MLDYYKYRLKLAAVIVTAVPSSIAPGSNTSSGEMLSGKESYSSNDVTLLDEASHNLFGKPKPGRMAAEATNTKHRQPHGWQRSLGI